VRVFVDSGWLGRSLSLGNGIMQLAEVPSLSAGEAAAEDFARLFNKFQVVILRGYGVSALNKDEHRFGLRNLHELSITHPESVAKTWGVENGPAALKPALLGRAADLAAQSGSQTDGGERWYTSFLVQKDGAFEKLLGELPIREPEVLSPLNAFHTPCTWVFVCKNVGGANGSTGANAPANPLLGRAEHIDAVQHSGTWHLQVSGTKRWRIRPNTGGDWAAARVPSAVRSAAGGSGPFTASDVPTLNKGQSHLTVTVEAGDVFVINTRLWFHQTEIHDTSSAAERVSFSYARDFFLPHALPSHAADKNAMGAGEAVSSEMTNVEGTYATSSFETEDVVMTETALEALVNFEFCAENNYVACVECLRPLADDMPVRVAKLMAGQLDRFDVLEARRSKLSAEQMGDSCAANVKMLPLNAAFCDKVCLQR